MPDLFQQILQENLLGFYLCDGFRYSGLTGKSYNSQRYLKYFIIINAKVLKENVSEWLTRKEATCFINDNSRYEIEIDGGHKYKALLPVLIHEFAHITDMVLGISPRIGNPNLIMAKDYGKETGMLIRNAFIFDAWKSPSAYSPIDQYDYKFRDLISYYHIRNGPHIGISKSAEVYQHLFYETPFVSLYGSQSCWEDFAESVMFYYLVNILKQPYSISLHYDQLKTWGFNPLEDELIRKRMGVLEIIFE
jgi:hypothetical protein